MLKTLYNFKKQNKEKLKVPQSVQDTIPIKFIWKDGIFLVGTNKYSKTWQFTDILEVSHKK